MRKTKEQKHLSLKLKRWDDMDKMCELSKALSDLKLTRNEIRKGLSGFEVLTISKRCKTTVNETCELIERFLKNNADIKFLKRRATK